MSQQISVVINTYNAAKHLASVLESVKDFDEVLICDMESTDQTLAIASQYGCRICTFPKGSHSIVEPARQFAIDQATHNWVLVVDADEVVTPQLRQCLYQLIENDQEVAGVAIPRRNYFMGKFMHAAYPDYILRLLRRDKAQWPPIIHSSPKVDGKVIRLPKHTPGLAFEHLANDSVADIIRKNNTYSEYEVIRRQNKNYGLGRLLLRPSFRFFKSYILNLGIIDGRPGLIFALLQASYQFFIVAKLMEKKLQNNKKTQE